MSRAHPSDIAWLGDLAPCEVLYEFEGPCIFTTRTPSGTLLLAYLSEELEAEARLGFILASTSEQTISELKAGDLSVLEALARGSLWRLTTNYARVPVALTSVLLSELPEHTLPAPGSMLGSQHASR